MTHASGHGLGLDRPRTARDRAGERGQALIVAVLAMAAILAMAAYAIDTAEWWTHGHHLQEQADAAALAAAQQYTGTCQTTTETNIAQAAAQYGGGGTATVADSTGNPSTVSGGSSTYNQQLYPTTSSTGNHNLITLINSNTFDTPNYSGPLTGHPCADGTIDVKLSETNLPSLLPFVNPQYVRAEASVGFYQASSATGAEPFIFSNNVPSHIWVQLRDVSTDAPVGSAVALTPPSGAQTNWTGTITQSLADSAQSPTTYNVGLRVIGSAFPTTNNVAPACPTDYSGHVQAPNGVVCYDIGVSNPAAPADEDGGIDLIRVWVPDNPYNPVALQTPGSPYSVSNPAYPGAPTVSDAWLVPSGDSCGSSPGANAASFTDSSSAQSLVVCANMTYTNAGGTPLTCAQSALTTTAIQSQQTTNSPTTTNYSMTCPAGGPNGVWSSPSITIPANSGPTFFSLTWGLYAGACPVENDSTSTNVVPCPNYSELNGRLRNSGQTSGEQTSGTHHGSSCSVGSPCICSSSFPCACNSNTCACASSQPCICTGGNPCACSSSNICTCGPGSSNECLGSFDGYAGQGVNGTCSATTTTFVDSSTSSCGEIVQMTWAGAYNQYSATFNRAGPITSVAITDGQGHPVQSVQSSNNASTLNVSLSLVPGFQNDTVASAGNPVTLNAGDDDFSGEWDCAHPLFASNPGGTAAFNKQIQWWIEEGCTSAPPVLASPPQTPPARSTDYGMASDPSNQNPPSCAGASSSPSTPTSYCVDGTTDPNITYNVMDGLNERIYGMTCDPGQPCTGQAHCNNYWNSSNSVNQILNETPQDPRLITLPITYYGAFYPNAYVGPPALTTPIIGFAEFYLTGWWGDPCQAGGPGTGIGQINNGLTVSADDTPPVDLDESGAIDSNLATEDTAYNCIGVGAPGQPAGCSTGFGAQVACTSSSPSYTTAPNYCSDQGMIMGHFLKYVDPVGQGTPSNTPCTANTLGICVAILNK